MLDQVKVDYYGTDTPLAQVAQDLDARGAADPGVAVGDGDGGADREGDPDEQSRLQPDARRKVIRVPCLR